MYYLFVLIFLASNAFAETENDAGSILENFAKQDKHRVSEMGLNIYSIDTFSRATSALALVHQLGRDKVLVDKTFDKNGDSYNIVIPGKLESTSVWSNSYGTSRDFYRKNQENGDDNSWYYGHLRFSGKYNRNDAIFNSHRPPGVKRGR